jgi:hypothetical protein
MPVVYLVVGPIRLLRVVFMAAWTASTPQLVGPALIGPATSYFEAAFNLGFVIGPALAGVLVGVVGPGPTLALDAASFGASAASLWLVRVSLRSEAPPSGQHLLHEIGEGLRFVWRHRTLRTVIAFWGAVSVATAALVVAMTIYVERDRGLDAFVFGMVLSAYSLGSVGGALVAARLTLGRIGPLMLGGTVVTGGVLLVIAGIGIPAVLIAGSLAAGVAQAVVLTSYVTLRAAIPPNELLGRVGSTARLVSLGLQPIGMLAGGAFLDATDGGTTLAVMGLLLVAISVLFASSRTLRGARAVAVA